jgi:flagellar protein FlgJ
MSPLLPAAGMPAAASADAGAGGKPTKVRDAAQQFEALLIGQILRSVRESGGWLGSKDSASDCAAEYAEQQFAQVIAQRGGLGLADLIARGLDPDSGSR